MTMSMADEIALHEAERDEWMRTARAYRDELDGMRQTDPDQYALFDRERSIAEPVYLARLHNRAAWLLRWHERTTPKQSSLFGGTP